MSAIVLWILVLIALGFVIAATVSLVRALRRGEKAWPALKKWFVSLYDAISGIG